MGAAVAGNLLRNGVELTLFDLAGAANVPPPLEDDLRGRMELFFASGGEPDGLRA